MHTRNRLLLTILAATACAAAQAETERRELRGFTAIDAGGGVNVDVRIGDEFLVEVESDEDLEDVETEVRNGTLHIGIDRDGFGWGDWQDAYHVLVVMPALEELEASGGVDVTVSGVVTGAELSIDASGGADVEVEVAVNRLDIEASGGADVEVSGTATTAYARSSGGSDLDARRLEATDAELRASGGADLAMGVSGTLDASASGGSDIDYYGSPEVLDEDASGSSDIRGH